MAEPSGGASCKEYILPTSPGRQAGKAWSNMLSLAREETQLCQYLSQTAEMGSSSCLNHPVYDIVIETQEPIKVEEMAPAQTGSRNSSKQWASHLLKGKERGTENCFHCGWPQKSGSQALLSQKEFGSCIFHL